jgi:Monooxygenase af470-like
VEVQRGRYTADIDGDFVVFLIGMRLNHPLRIRKWWPVATAMPRMLKVLSQHPELGCLGFQQWFGRTTLMVQYWRDFDSLDRFARDRDLPHLEPWRRFNRAVRASGDVGIWHETFKVRAGEYEAVYGNMPVFGLAAAGRHLPAGRKADTAAARIGATTADEPVVEPY